MSVLRISPVLADAEHPLVAVVRVDLLNDDGERAACIAAAETVEQAVEAAERKTRAVTGDESWVMNDWRAA